LRTERWSTGCSLLQSRSQQAKACTPTKAISDEFQSGEYENGILRMREFRGEDSSTRGIRNIAFLDVILETF
jgi:hypothetical protein